MCGRLFFVLALLLLALAEARTMYAHLGQDQASIEFSSTLYFADLRPTVRWHVGSRRATSDWGLALTSTPPGFADGLYPEVGLFANASSAVQSVTRESPVSLWLSRTRALSLGRARDLHVTAIPLPNGTRPAHGAQDHAVNGWLFVGPGSALWRSLAGYVMNDFRFALVRDAAYFALLGGDPGTVRLTCEDAVPAWIRNILPLQPGSCYALGLDYNVVLDLEAPANYLPSELYEKWIATDRAALPSVALVSGARLYLVTHGGMSYSLNPYSNEIVLGAAYLRHWDEVAYDAAARTYYLRSDAATSNLRLGADIVNTLAYLLTAYLFTISHSSTHFAIPRYVLHYQSRKRGVPTEVGLDGRRVRFEVAALVLAAAAVGSTAATIPEGYQSAFAALTLVIVVHSGVALYILIRSPALTRAGLLGKGATDEGDEQLVRQRLAQHRNRSFMDLPDGTFLYPSLALRDSTQRALARGTNHIMLVYATALMLTVAIANHALFLLLGSVLTSLLTFALSYHIAGMALFIRAMDGSAVPARFAPLWYVYMVVQILTTVVSVVVGTGYFVWPYVVYASNSYHDTHILSAVLPLGVTMLVFSGVLKLHLDVRSDLETADMPREKAQ